ncbi:hypothetical protein [Bacillus subtilis]|uniref:hypothetical protein n=1 Tax=Bacillus subtilis TaxID=1423 RepID=UPI00397B1F8E
MDNFGYLNNHLERYEHLTLKKINGSRYRLQDECVNKSLSFNLKGIEVESNYMNMKKLHLKFENSNDYKYFDGHGFCIEDYAEFGITGFFDEEFDYTSFETDVCYSFGKYKFIVSDPSNLFQFLTWFEDETKFDYKTIKLFGTSQDTALKDLEKAVFYIGSKFLEDDEAYKEFLYPRIVDLREVGVTAVPFNYTEINLNINWDSPIANNLSLFNYGESTDHYNFFAYYRFIETFFDTGNEEDELIALVESIDNDELLIFAKDHNLIEANGTAKTLAKTLYKVRNNYVHHKLRKERIVDPYFNVPVAILSKWKVISREIAIQLLNINCL